MKKILIIAGFFSITFANAQLALSTHEDEPILDGDVLIFNSTLEEESKLSFWIHNTDEENDIQVKVEVLEIVNTDGSAFTFCIGEFCIFSISEGGVYPSDAAVIPAGGTGTEFDYLWNNDEGDGSNYPLDYVFKFFVTDDLEGEGESITFTYRYEPDLNVVEHQSIEVLFYQTIVKDIFSFQVKESLDMAIYDIKGSLLLASKIDMGVNSVDMTNFKAGIYILKFNDSKGNVTAHKIFKE